MPTVHRDLVFAQPAGETLRCDLYLPPQAAADQLRPGVVVIHGGGWAHGDKWTMASFCDALARAGIVAMSINYRHAPEWKYPAQVEDARAALLWMANQGRRFGIDPQRLGALGYSAGAHLACMLGVLADEPADVRWRATQGDAAEGVEKSPAEFPSLRAVVAGGAPCDFRDLPPDNAALEYFFGGTRRECPERYRLGSPVTHASHGDPPILFFHGTRDLIVPDESSRRLYDKHRELGVPSRFLSIENQGHVVTFLSTKARQAAVDFLVEQLQPAGQNEESANEP